MKKNDINSYDKSRTDIAKQMLKYSNDKSKIGKPKTLIKNQNQENKTAGSVRDNIRSDQEMSYNPSRAWVALRTCDCGWSK